MGYVANPPWVVVPPGAVASRVQGIEADLVNRLAVRLHASIEWVAGTESEHHDALRHGSLDLLIAGLTDQSPLVKDLGVTRPYHTDAGPGHARRVMATPPGENAWLMWVEQGIAP